MEKRRNKKQLLVWLFCFTNKWPVPVILISCLLLAHVTLPQPFHFTSSNDGQDYGYYLRVLVFKTLESETYSFCWLKCIEEAICMSLNFDLTTGKCELSRYNKHMALPIYYQQKHNSIHFSKPSPDECKINGYNNFTEPDRNINFTATGPQCDTDLVTGQWYRFVGAAGTRMLDYCPKSSACNSGSSFFMKTPQPAIGEEKVKSRLCLNANGKCCEYPRNILATNCGPFIVYQLKSSNCPNRHCGVN